MAPGRRPLCHIDTFLVLFNRLAHSLGAVFAVFTLLVCSYMLFHWFYSIFPTNWFKSSRRSEISENKKQ